MAENDFEGAAAFFYSSRFEDILTEEEDRTIYRGLSMQEGNLQNVEEFLIAVCGKEKTTFEPVEKSLFLQTRVKAGRTEGRLAGSRAERAIEAHRQRVRRSGMAGGTARQDAASGLYPPADPPDRKRFHQSRDPHRRNLSAVCTLCSTDERRIFASFDGRGCGQISSSGDC